MQASEETNSSSPVSSAQIVDATRFFSQVGGTATDWDALAANYLGAAAMHHAGGGAKAHPLARNPVNAIRNELRFPAIYKSPKGFDPAKVRVEFRNLLKATIEERSR